MAKSPTAGKVGRPRARNLSPAAVEYILTLNKGAGLEPASKNALASMAGISPSQLGDALGARHRGVSENVVRRMADVLGCKPEVIAPELTGRFVGLRPDDEVVRL